MGGSSSSKTCPSAAGATDSLVKTPTVKVSLSKPHNRIQLQLKLNCHSKFDIKKYLKPQLNKLRSCVHSERLSQIGNFNRKSAWKSITDQTKFLKLLRKACCLAHCEGACQWRLELR